MLFLLFNGMKKQNTGSQTNAPYQDCTMNGTTRYGEKILIRQNSISAGMGVSGISRPKIRPPVPAPYNFQNTINAMHDNLSQEQPYLRHDEHYVHHHYQLSAYHQYKV